VTLIAGAARSIVMLTGRSRLVWPWELRLALGYRSGMYAGFNEEKL